MADIKRKKKSLLNARSYFGEYCDYTGIHGFKFFGEKRSIWEKIIWAVIFFLSLTSCILVVYEVFKKWQKSPIIVNFASQQVNIFDITFPAVTICPETKVLSDHFNYSHVLRTSRKQNISDVQMKHLQYMSLLCNINMYYSNIPKVETVDEGFYDFLKGGAPRFFTKCNFMDQHKNCDEIFQPIYTDEGLCYTFNMLSKQQLFTKATENIDLAPPSYNDTLATNWSADFGYTDNAKLFTYPRRALLAGSTHSLTVSLSVNNTDLDFGCTHFQGYKVVLHSPHRFPTSSPHYFRIPLKKSVSAAITPSQLITSDDVVHYSIKKRGCFFQTDMQLKYFSKYSQMNCKQECFLNLTLENCGCVEYFMPRNKSIPICGTNKYGCIRDVRIHLNFMLLKTHINQDEYIEKLLKNREQREFMAKITSKNFCNCPEMCNSIDYNVEITESDYDWFRKMETLGMDVVEDEEGVSTSQLEIYFKGSTFIPQERNELFNTFEFLANVGGLLGLFIGFSLLSMVELIYFLTLRIFCNLRLFNNWHGQAEAKSHHGSHRRSLELSQGVWVEENKIRFILKKQ